MALRGRPGREIGAPTKIRGPTDSDETSTKNSSRKLSPHFHRGSCRISLIRSTRTGSSTNFAISCWAIVEGFQFGRRAPQSLPRCCQRPQVAVSESQDLEMPLLAPVKPHQPPFSQMQLISPPATRPNSASEPDNGSPPPISIPQRLPRQGFTVSPETTPSPLPKRSGLVHQATSVHHLQSHIRPFGGT